MSANIKFAEVAEIYFSQQTITKEHGFVRVPEPERVVTMAPVVVDAVIPNSKDEVKSEVSSEEPKPSASNCVWEGFNIDEKISEKIKGTSSSSGK